MSISKEHMKVLIKAERGELDAAWMYRRLAKKVKDPKDAEYFERLAGDELRHAAVFIRYTGKKVRSNPAKAVFIPLLYKIIGKEKLYPVIAKAEYAAAEKYKSIIADYPEVEAVMNDETYHGDAVMSLLD